jgi:hypothetical protein
MERALHTLLAYLQPIISSSVCLNMSYVVQELRKAAKLSKVQHNAQQALQGAGTLISIP